MTSAASGSIARIVASVVFSILGVVIAFANFFAVLPAALKGPADGTFWLLAILTTAVGLLLLWFGAVSGADGVYQSESS